MELLSCETCPISLHPEAEVLIERMCPVVTNQVVSRLGEAGIDTSSDLREAKDILPNIIGRPVVRELAEIACQGRLLQLQSTNRGYGAVTY